MLRSFLRVLGAILLGSVAAACASEATLLDSNEDDELADLSGAERAQLCARSEGEVLDERMHRAHCLALVAGAELCEASLADCLQMDMRTRCSTYGGPCWNPLFEDPGAHPVAYCEPSHLGSCDATIGEWRTCMSESFDALERAFADRDCGAFSEFTDEETKLFMPPSCSALFERCPGLLPQLAPSGPGSTHGSIAEDNCVFEVELETSRGAVRHLSSWGGGSCGIRKGGPLSPRLGLDFAMPEGLEFGLAVLATSDYPAATERANEALGLALLSPAGVGWSTPDGCTGMLSTSACDEGAGNVGVRYRITQGRCDAPLKFEQAGGASDLRVKAFAATTHCLIDRSRL